MVPRTQTSAAGVLALLSEQEPLLQQHALKQLNILVPQFWAEISESVSVIEALFESRELSKDARDLAALIASKVYYYLGEYDEALSFALGAGNAFETERDVESSEEYVETIVSKAIDRYIDIRASEESGATYVKIDPRLAGIIEGIFNKCIEDGEHKQALGIALESSRLDIITQIYELTRDTDILSYIMEAVLDTGFTLAFRDKVLHHILPLFPPLAPKARHIHTLTRIHVALSSPPLTIPLLSGLVEEGLNGDKDQLAVAYQIAFDLVEGATQDFLEAVRSGFPELAPTEEGSAPIKTPRSDATERLRTILSGETSILFYSDFFERNNHGDLLVLKDTKDSLDARSSIFHSALTFSNAFMHAGTNSDEFLRNNLDWLGRASNWSKFSATAALGVIHKGNIRSGMELLRPYLPQPDGSSQPGGSQWSEGGALYGLGLIHAGRGKEILGQLRGILRGTSNEVVQHGAALGVGVAGIAGQDREAYDDLKQALYTDSAIAGEAAGYSMGLVMLGSGSVEIIDEMWQYAHETQHEKIIRGLAIGIAFICYGKQEQADSTIEKLLTEKDPILRYGGAYTLALAYAGTSDNGAVQKLLHIAVSDTSDDVRRAAVTSLAFLLFKNPNQVPRMVQLLSESYNPHVRCGATLALGISCAGTGSQDAIDLLEPMTKDPVDFVRQGAFVSLAMILVQQSDASPSLTSTRTLFTKIVSDKHEDPMARFGAALAQGLIGAGGRNATISLLSRAGSKNMNAIVGMTLFTQFWYWYPLAHCACLAFVPTAIIGVTDELRTPVFSFISDAKPSLFAYPSITKPTAEKPIEKVATAVLSTTARVKARERIKEKKQAEAMETDKPAEKAMEDVDMKDESSSITSTAVPASGSDDAGTLGASTSDNVPSASSSKREKKPAEPTSEVLQNLSRVTLAQLAYIVFPPENRFQPVRAVASSRTVSSPTGKKVDRYAGGGGILVLVDSKPEGEPEWVLSLAEQAAAAAAPPQATPPASQLGAASAPAPASGSHGEPALAAAPSSVTDDEPVPDPPASFEYPFDHDS
ncbi:26S proteasome regulatory complex, non-ATPase subcomplex, Rpn2/Psmd1 subunit [Cantharellus anzutake]|uniref:26S proteasome regulatory complex, non-ATPase subcomplex, Rpn2/Psmd1 subunit n=1 Tax=Cantharellus anzutake TaxID=1750568 RepID=UPI0019040954|nr:26S proteasome regulatory complex, non-ATPase subcomplex, Rpn2/Psmd1 subunit [Cantharellus anzutake]KAF8331501.1 26S proteasome regulatory complex, non-ATPase subcomplex, Rpn2/Psmd1 subunit [Cantharellus anzutake]